MQIDTFYQRYLQLSGANISNVTDCSQYKTQQWSGNNVEIRTDTGYVNIQHDEKDNVLVFYSDDLATKQFENIKQLINVIMSNEHRIYLEWCQEEIGSYIYFDLTKIIQKLQNYKSIDVDLLNINNPKNDKNNIDKSCYFDESVPIESELRITDILILSPLRSTLCRYSRMGIFEGHQLYLGPTPTQQFINQFKILYIFNCCQRNNAQKLLNATKAKERLFDVVKWKRYKKEEKSDDDEMDGMQYLDIMIDEIHLNLQKGNVIIHCLAGAHRSPFVTSCYLYKYGLKGIINKKSAKDIYKYLKEKRPIVQEMGYGKQLTLYQTYLKQKYPHYKSD